MVAVILDRGDHGFHRLLAKLLGAMLRTLVQELDGVGRLASRRGAGRRLGVFRGGRRL